MAPRQSGHFKSEWYNNQFEDWVTGDYHVTILNEPITEDQTLIFITTIRAKKELLIYWSSFFSIPIVKDKKAAPPYLEG